MKSRTAIIVALTTCFGMAPANAQTADDVVSVLTSDADNLGTEVAEYCRQSDEADRETQIAVGAGFAQAYLYFAGIGDRPSASTISQIACTCERTVGEILSSYLASLGELDNEACSTQWRVDSSDSTTSVFRFGASGSAASGQ